MEPGRNFFDQFDSDATSLAGITYDERVFGNRVHDTRYPSRVTIDSSDCFRRKHMFGARIRPRQFQPADDIFSRFLLVQGTEPAPQTDALFQLNAIRRVDSSVQFRLANNNNLQQFLPCSFEVSQQTDLFQHLPRQKLSFIHNEYCSPASAKLVAEEFA